MAGTDTARENLGEVLGGNSSLSAYTSVGSVPSKSVMPFCALQLTVGTLEGPPEGSGPSLGV